MRIEIFIKRNIDKIYEWKKMRDDELRLGLAGMNRTENRDSDRRHFLKYWLDLCKDSHGSVRFGQIAPRIHPNNDICLHNFYVLISMYVRVCSCMFM